MKIGLIISNLIFHNFFRKQKYSRNFIVAVFWKRKGNITGSIVSYYLIALKVEKIYLLEGQTGEILLYDKTSMESKNFERGYRQFKYTKAGKIKIVC